MPVFMYRGLNKSGKNVSGTIDSDNLRSAKLKLKKDGVYVTDIKDKTKQANKPGGKKPKSVGGVSIQDMAMMTRQLATLLKANIPLVDSLQAVADQVENPKLSEIISEGRNSVNEGGSFSKHLAKYPKVFNKIFVSMCEAGEMSGTLDVILLRLAEFTESQHQLNSKIKSAMIYPMIMFVFIGMMLIGLFIFVIPQITDVFDSFPELELPWYSQSIITFSEFLVDYWHIIFISFFAMYMLFRNWKNSENGSKQYDVLLLKIPVVGKLVRLVAVSRFTRTLATLLSGGVPMLSALTIVRNVVNNEVLAKAIDTARDNISEGETIASPLKQSGQFPPIVIHMVSIGEKTGELENMLTQVSDAYDFQVKNSVEGLTSILEPVMLVVMGLVIGVIVFAIMIPIFELQNMGS